MTFRNHKSAFSDPFRLQQEVTRLETVNGQLQHQYSELAKEAQRLAELGAKMDQNRLTVAAWAIAMLLEHHAGECVITVPLIEELGKQSYGVKSEVDPDGIHLKLTAIDAAATPIKQASAIEGVVKEGERIQSKPVEVVEKVRRCGACGRNEPAHNLDCEFFGTEFGYV